jgi:hypothetical protein
MFESTTDETRTATIQVALVLLAAVAIAILDVWGLVSGRTLGHSPLSTGAVAVGCLAAMFHFKEMLLRVALTLIGMQAATRLILSRTQVSVGWLHLANVAGRTTQLLGVIIIIFVILKWFGSSRREKTSL